jgi:hypothetical protein
LPESFPAAVAKQPLDQGIPSSSAEVKQDWLPGSGQELLMAIGPLTEVQEIVEPVLYLESAAFATGEPLHAAAGAHAGHW